MISITYEGFCCKYCCIYPNGGTILVMISHSKIDRIGDKIRGGEPLTGLQKQDLLDWRNSFVPVLDYYHKRLLLKIPKSSVFLLGKRLKRIPSIHKKLKRSKTLRLSSMQDIAGIRVVFPTPEEMLEAVNAVRSSSSKNKFKKLHDYHSRPKSDGYRSVHLVYQVENPKRLIELQFRTAKEHMWATAVEIYGSIQTTSFKTGDGSRRWKEFFRLLSSLLALSENGSLLEEHSTYSESKIRSHLKKAMKELRVIEKLAAVTKGFETIVKSHSHGKRGKFALVELDTAEAKTSIDIYTKKNIPKALEIYTERELQVRDDPTKNIVFVNIESLESLQAAYPNYFLNTDKLIQSLGRIALDQKLESL